jgi:hypothetical protein
MTKNARIVMHGRREINREPAAGIDGKRNVDTGRGLLNKTRP